MNLALDRYADNPIIDELLVWPPDARRIISVRACCPMFRRPFIEVEMDGGEIILRHFPRESFAEFWAEAVVILTTLTTIELISDLEFALLKDRENLAAEVLAARDECIAESNQMYAEGMFEQFLFQYGADCKDLPEGAQQKVAEARRRLDKATKA